MLIACTRARLMGEGEKTVEGTDQEGAMAVVELSREELEGFVDKHPEAAGVEPAVYAGPGMTTVGGPGKAVDYLVAALEELGNVLAHKRHTFRRRVCTDTAERAKQLARALLLHPNHDVHPRRPELDQRPVDGTRELRRVPQPCGQRHRDRTP